MAKKTETLKCELNGETGIVLYKKCKRDQNDEWETIDQEVFDLTALPNVIQGMCAAYGLRAILADRTSDAGKLGVDKLGWMREVYEMFKGGDWNKPRAISGKKIDPAMITLITELKNVTYTQAEKALSDLTSDQRKGLAEKFQTQLSEIRSRDTGAIDLTDLGDL